MSGEELSAWVDAVAEALAHVPLDEMTGFGQLLAPQVQQVHGNEVINFAMHQQDRWPSHGFGQMLGAGEQA